MDDKNGNKRDRLPTLTISKEVMAEFEKAKHDYEQILMLDLTNKAFAELLLKMGMERLKQAAS